MFRLLVALTSCVNAVIALSLSIAGAMVLCDWGSNISNARGSEEFGVGMMLGGLAVLTWLLAAAFVVVAYLCWRSHRRLAALNPPRIADYAVLIIGLVSVAIVLTTLVARFLV
jgi:hypothetical protein